MKENQFQAQVIKNLQEEFPGCVVLKNDANYLQGVPDLSVFYKDHWGMLECKRSDHEPLRPNQDYYVRKFDDMSFASVITPETENVVYRNMREAWGY